MLILPAQHITRQMPENYRDGDLDFCRAEFAYDTDAIEQLHFKHAYVTFNGLLYDEKYKIVKASLINPEHYTPLSRFKHFKKVVLKRKLKLPDNQKYLLCFDEWTGNHYHWLCDFLPRLLMARNELAHYTLLLPDLPYIRTTGTKLLEYFNLKPRSITWLQPRQMVKVPNLTLISHAVLSGRIHDPLMQQLRDRLHQHFTLPQVKPTRRIYISRAHAAYRKVLNEDEVVKMVQAYGFEVINFENFTTEQQMQLANQTAILVSIHGAGLTNTLFMQKQAVVLEFKRSRIYYNQCYWHLAAALNLKYNYLFGQPDQDDVVLEGIGCNLTIPIDALRTALEQALNQAGF